MVEAVFAHSNKWLTSSTGTTFSSLSSLTLTCTRSHGACLRLNATTIKLPQTRVNLSAVLRRPDITGSIEIEDCGPDSMKGVITSRKPVIRVCLVPLCCFALSTVWSFEADQEGRKSWLSPSSESPRSFWILTANGSILRDFMSIPHRKVPCLMHSSIILGTLKPVN